jgi:hypothetical protein
VLKIRDILAIIIAVLIAGCSGDDITAGGSLEGKDYDPVGTPVQFSVGLEGKATTRAVMADGGRFVCTMYYKPSETGEYYLLPENYGGSMKTAWLQIYGSGNAKYMDYSFSDEATSLFWENRWSHVFLALADYNKLMDNVGATYAAGTQGMLKMYPNNDTYHVEGTPYVYYYINTYDLTKGERASMIEQPDPILALTTKTPVGDPSAEANRVTLNFKHQFAQIQVNVKDKTGNYPAITAGQISKVELIGVATKGFVYSRIKADGTVGNAIYYPSQSGNFEMFEMASPADGCLKSFNAIAYGHLTSISVTWNDGSSHTSTLSVNSNLTSGTKYVYNLEISRTAVTTRGDIGNRSNASEQVYIKDVEITNWPVKFE